MTEKITAKVIPFRKPFKQALLDLIERYPEMFMRAVAVELRSAADHIDKVEREAQAMAARRQREEDR